MKLIGQKTYPNTLAGYEDAERFADEWAGDCCGFAVVIEDTENDQLHVMDHADAAGFMAEWESRIIYGADQRLPCENLITGCVGSQLLQLRLPGQEKDHEMTSPTTTRANPVHDGFAVASLILGIFPVIPVAGSILAIVFGAVSRSAARREGRKPSGLASWGIMLGAVTMIIAILAVAILVGAFKTAPDSTQQFIQCLNNNVANGTNYPC